MKSKLPHHSGPLNLEKTIVIEVCKDCHTHQWNTRHDEAKYARYALQMAEAIKKMRPDVSFVYNQVPKEWAMEDIYCQLVPNEDKNVATYDMIPRIGAFEVSYKGIILFSKMMSSVWPHFQAVATYCDSMFNDVQVLSHAELSRKYTTNGKVLVQPRAGKGDDHSAPLVSPGRKPDPSTKAQPAKPEPVDHGAPVPNVGGPIQCGQHLKSDRELFDKPGSWLAFPEGTKSSLSKFCTKEIFQQLTGKKDDMGFDFATAIFSGAKNTDSGIGVYAGSHSSYTAFAPLMDKIIEDYHGHGPTAKHESKMSTDGMNCPTLPVAGQIMIKSTRIRVARNAANYCLGPGISTESRAELEGKVVKGLKNMTGELSGNYYPLDGMDAATQKQLIEDHFLFKEGDRFLEACNLNRDWPKSRGIYHNTDKTFLVWVNEEDHLRIISMQQGASLFQVFKRLIAGAGALEAEIPFQHDGHLGYITSCPTNCGTGLRASVHIHLPNLGKDKAAFQAIADKFNVQIRGAHGEHTETDDHIYDISNRRRLGFSEASLVQDMYNGVSAMIDAELKLVGKDKAEPEAVFKYLSDLKILAGKGMDDKLSGEECAAICGKIEQVEIQNGLDAQVAKEEDGSCSVKALVEALAKH